MYLFVVRTLSSFSVQNHTQSPKTNSSHCAHNHLLWPHPFRLHSCAVQEKQILHLSWPGFGERANMSSVRPRRIIPDPDPIPPAAICLVGFTALVIMGLWVWAACHFQSRIRRWQEIQLQANNASWEEIFRRSRETGRLRERRTEREVRWLRIQASEMSDRDSDWDGETLRSDSAHSDTHVRTPSINSAYSSTTEAGSETDDPEQSRQSYGTFDGPGLGVLRDLITPEQEPRGDFGGVVTWIRNASWPRDRAGRSVVDEESGRHV